MKNKNQSPEQYFSENASAWVEDQYKKSTSYPVAPNRIRIALSIVNEHFGSSGFSLIDLGCGDGSLCIAMSEKAEKITGVDQSESMLLMAKEKAKILNPETASKISFIHSEITELTLSQSFDVITSMGVYEYIKDQDSFFAKAYELAKPGGLFLMDCRNRLFNMASISDYTVKEINSGNAINLVNEIKELYSAIIPEKEQEEFIARLNAAAPKLSEIPSEISSEKISFSGKIEGTQQTPKEISELAEKHGFSTIGYAGVHPHLIAPALAKKLKPGVFNMLSDALQAFERQPLSLLWSSKFIVILKKQNEKAKNNSKA